jgi:hypothetical protein
VEILVTDRTYADRQACPAEPRGVLIGCPPTDLEAAAARYLALPEAQRPLLVCAYLPSSAPVDFVSLGLPRPVPILPLLIRKQVYTHEPGGPHPSAESQKDLLLEAFAKSFVPSSP